MKVQRAAAHALRPTHWWSDDASSATNHPAVGQKAPANSGSPEPRRCCTDDASGPDSNVDPTRPGRVLISTRHAGRGAPPTSADAATRP